MESACEKAISNVATQTSIGRYRGNGYILDVAGEKARRHHRRHVMRYTWFTAAALSLATATAFGQQPSGQATAVPQRQQLRESDSTFIAREWAAWNALKDGDST